MLSADAAADFTWPDFDRWQAFFTADGTFPAGWDGLHVTPPAQTLEAAVYQQRKQTLFSEWLDMLAHYARQGIGARIERQHAGPACPVCDPFNAREVGPGLEAVPPFHPGCRCVLVAVHTPPANRRPRAYARSRSRAR